MVGGTVVDKWIWLPDRVQVVVMDNNDCLGIDLVKNDNSLSISRGDTVWWQGRSALWTPADKSLNDIKIPRLSNSYRVDNCKTPGRTAPAGKD